MKVFIYDKRHSKPYTVLKDVRGLRKKKYKTTIYQN